MLGMVKIPAKAGVTVPYSCLPAGRDCVVKALSFQMGFTSLSLSIGFLFLFSIFNFRWLTPPHHGHFGSEIPFSKNGKYFS